MESSNPNTQPQRRLKSTVALQIVQAATRKDVALPKLAKLAQADPAFALRVLAMVNSPSFALAQRVGDLQQAVPLLGIRGMRNLALSLALSDMTPLGKEGSLLLANSIRRATAEITRAVLGDPEPDRISPRDSFSNQVYLSAPRMTSRRRRDRATASALSHKTRTSRWMAGSPSVRGRACARLPTSRRYGESDSVPPLRGTRQNDYAEGGMGCRASRGSL